MLDHLYYPHIIDILFAYAPPHSLIVMSGVCRQWREEVMHRFCHVRDFSNSSRKGINRIRFSFGYSSKANPTTLQLRPDQRECSEWVTKTFFISLPWVRVLDIHGQAVLSCIKTPRLEVIRFATKPRKGMVIPFEANIAVFDNFYTSNFLNKSLLKKIVFVHRQDFFVHREGSGKYLDPNDLNNPPRTLESVVYVLLGDHPDFGLEPEDRDRSRYYRGLAEAFEMAMRHNIDSFTVNVPKDIIDTELAWRLKQVSGVIRPLSLDRYRRKMGEALFAIETDMTSPLAL